MDYTVIHDDKVNRFEVLESGQIAYLQYILEDYILDIRLVVIPSQLEGFGIGSSLVIAAMKYAIKKHLRIRTTSLFAKNYFERHPQYDKILA